MSTAAIRELAKLPSLRNRWVAIDPRGAQTGKSTPLFIALRSGAVVVDADEELPALCARVNAANLTALTIVYARAEA